MFFALSALVAPILHNYGDRRQLEAYRDAGVSLPFPQREVRLLRNG